MESEDTFDIGVFWRNVSVQDSEAELEKALAFVKNKMKLTNKDEGLIEKLRACKKFLEGKIDKIKRRE